MQYTASANGPQKSGAPSRLLLAGWVFHVRLAALLVLTSTPALAQLPSPELPRVYIDTHWAQPTDGKTWRTHTADEFQHALNGSNPGDIIILDAGATYAGSFTVPAKANLEHKWIYIQGADLP